MKKCSKCGRILKNDANFCTACGGDSFTKCHKKSTVITACVLLVTVSLALICDASVFGIHKSELAKTMERLIKLNGGVMPEFETDSDNDVGVYHGVFSNKKVKNAQDAINSLENLKPILNIGDVSEEFVPFDDDNSTAGERGYKVQQVYNGVPVMGAQTVIGVNEKGYPCTVLNRYDDDISKADINTTPTVTEETAKQTITEHLTSLNAEYTNAVVDSIYLTIYPEDNKLIYNANVSCDNSLGYNYWIDAHTGEVAVSNEIVPQTEYSLPQGSEEQNVNMDGLSFTITDTKATENRYWSLDIANNIYIWNGNNRKVFEDDSIRIDYDWYNIFNKSDIDCFKMDQLGNIMKKNETKEMAYLLHNFSFTIDQYKELEFFDRNNVHIYSNLKYKNAGYWKFDNDNNVIFLYGKGNYAIGLDVAAHEYTHYFQAYNVNDNSESLANDSLGTGLGEAISGNTKWVEAAAISEGTADIMGMLIESIKGEVEFNSKDFWKMAEELWAENTYRNHYYYAVTALKGDSEHHITVDEMKNYYQKHPKLKYGKGPGHADTYILVRAFSKMIEKAPRTNQKNWFKLWGNAIKLLTPKSAFDDMRFALLVSAQNLGFGDDVIKAVKAGLDEVGIVEKGTGIPNSIMPYVAKAIQSGVLTNDSTKPDNAFRLNDAVTREELLKMAAHSCNFTAMLDYSWFDKGVIDYRWIDYDYIRKPIPRWEAAQVVYGVLRHKELQNKGSTKVYKYKYDRNGVNYTDYKQYFSADYGKSMPFDTVLKEGDTSDKVDNIRMLLNYNRGSSVPLYEGKSFDSSVADRLKLFQKEYGLKLRNGICDEETYRGLYNLGLYQLWMNGVDIEKKNNGGKSILDAAGQLTRAEACLWLYGKRSIPHAEAKKTAEPTAPPKTEQTPKPTPTSVPKSNIKTTEKNVFDEYLNKLKRAPLTNEYNPDNGSKYTRGNDGVVSSGVYDWDKDGKDELIIIELKWNGSKLINDLNLIVVEADSNNKAVEKSRVTLTSYDSKNSHSCLNGYRKEYITVSLHNNYLCFYYKYRPIEGEGTAIRIYTYDGNNIKLYSDLLDPSGIYYDSGIEGVYDITKCSSRDDYETTGECLYEYDYDYQKKKGSYSTYEKAVNSKLTPLGIKYDNQSEKLILNDFDLICEMSATTTKEVVKSVIKEGGFKQKQNNGTSTAKTSSAQNQEKSSIIPGTSSDKQSYTSYALDDITFEIRPYPLNSNKKNKRHKSEYGQEAGG